MTSLPSGSKEAPQTPSHWCLFGLASGVWGVPQRGPVLAVVLTQRGLGFRLDSCAVDPRRRARLSCQNRCLHFERPLRGADCLLETAAFRRAAGTGREDPQPDTSASQLWFAVQCGCLCVEMHGSEKAPLTGVWGVSPRP